MAYMQGQLEAFTQQSDPEDFYWYRESVALRQKVTDALAEPEPEGPTDEELMEAFDGEFAEFFDSSDGFGTTAIPRSEWIKVARAVLARWGRPAPAPAGEVAEAIADLRECADSCILSSKPYWAGPMRRAADLLERCQVAPVPMAVSERSTQIEDLAADAVSALRYIEQDHGRIYGVGWDRVYEKADRLRPAQTLPMPVGREPSDEELLELMPQQMRDDLAAAARALSGFDPDNIKAASAFRIILNRHSVDHARAVLARWGK
jgi:hypothetical protein